ncbi:hypothetical protein OGATHE_004853 [Ogataea polymorpha]|uniref:Secreted protein n=1 Tax=Ogataea polymorpha TaxID=460523 RepID=A0A9P8P173_9ASCO|nr:hypothetical protein OGATHE_004853 [Ogataea polymorpha]
MIGAAVVSFASLAFNCSGVSSSGEGDFELDEPDSLVEAGSGCGTLDDRELCDCCGLSLNWFNAVTNSLGSAPLSSFKMVPFLTKTNLAPSILPFPGVLGGCSSDGVENGSAEELFRGGVDSIPRLGVLFKLSMEAWLDLGVVGMLRKLLESLASLELEVLAGEFDK